MAKKKPARPARARSRWAPVAVAVLLMSVSVGIYLVSRSAPQSAATTASGSVEPQSPARGFLHGKVVLPAIPRRPRRLALSPERFADPLIRKSYEVARANPELLEQMPCYCGCYANPGHTNNLDCFVDKHGET